ncbi:MAG: tRNA (adenosine(37)-N6)-threonylcarbamoyltransferase complex ATPase subunit type 1 TsaE [Succinivibrionaceae bacterium]
MNSNKKYYLPTDNDTVCLGRIIGKECPLDMTIYLDGNLGAGKTTFTRGFIQELGYNDVVKSPTYTLVESYKIGDKYIYHFDLYRLSDPEELEMMGIRDYFTHDSIRIIEWAQNGEGFLPGADLIINIEYEGSGRLVTIIGNTNKGREFVSNLDLEPVFKIRQ